MGYKTWAAVKEEIRNTLWPFPTEARTQVAVHNRYFIEGIMDLQKWVLCLQANNASQFEFCSTYYQCAKTVVTGINFGVPSRVYTIANGDWCDPVPYRSASFDGLECFARSLYVYSGPDNTGMSTLPMGFKFAEASSDTDCAGGRARDGVWAVHRGRFYVAPWLQSNETLIVEWSGMKSDWVDTDLLDEALWTPRVLAALRAFVEWKHAARFGDDENEKMRLKQQYAEDLAFLIHDCREATQQQQDKGCVSDQPLITQAQLDDDVVP